ncbi:MAG: hypothetical protein LBN27_03920 [Prevotellaceae bacterium]|jgi:hypothetical protein|nr:hypothetical protein [Prevotellaceae bacterium]
MKNNTLIKTVFIFIIILFSSVSTISGAYFPYEGYYQEEEYNRKIDSPFDAAPYSEAEEYFRQNEQAIIPQNPFATAMDKDKPGDPGMNDEMEGKPGDPGKNAPVGNELLPLLTIGLFYGLIKYKKKK